VPSRWLRVALLAAVVAVATACQVDTRVAVTVDPGGSGTVAVTVTLDRAATAALGDVAGQLDVADLRQAGWTVTGPDPAADGSTVIEVVHPFERVQDIAGILDQVAGSPGQRPFRVTVRHRRSLWRTETSVQGAVDLRCGLSCFADQGLAGALGSPTGVDPGPLLSQAGQSAGSVFGFQLAMTLPGHLDSTNAPQVDQSRLTWIPRLGQQTTVLAATSTVNTGAITVAAVLGGVLLVAVGAALWRLWRRRRRRRRRQRHQAAAAARRTGPGVQTATDPQDTG
jgi:hypothetical protein